MPEVETMSNSTLGVADSDSRPDGVGPGNFVPAGLARPPAAGVAVAVAAYLTVFFSITNIVGGTDRVVAAVVIAASVGVVLARVLRVRAAALVSAGGLLTGLSGYYVTVPESQRALLSVSGFAFDVFSMLTGLSALRLAQADVWVLAVAPVPTFLTAYLVARGRYPAAATVCAAILGFFILTGDAGTVATLAGVLGIVIAVGLDTISVPAGLATQLDTLTVIIALMLLTSATLTVVPGGAAQPWTGGTNNPSVETSVVGGEESLEVVGAVRLDPAVRFTVQSQVESNWHVSSYDRYTGDGWVRSGELTTFDTELRGPPGASRSVEQIVTAKTDIQSFPAAWAPVAVSGAGAPSAQVTARGGIEPSATIRSGESFTVRSEIPQASAAELRAAGDSYPAGLVETYTQLPETTPDSVGNVSAQVIGEADTDTAHEAALAIERYLRQSKEYSLQVQRPDGDIAGSFLTNMDAGYCVYFATTMVAMLRSQGIPSKFVTGYTAGEETENGEYVVRGQNAHAWVMVYFPDHGWVEFDPTPSSDRDDARDVRLADARQTDREDVDTEQSSPDSGDDTQAETTQESQDASDSASGSADIENPADTSPSGSGAVVSRGLRGELDRGVPEAAISQQETNRVFGIAVPDRQTVGYALLVLFGVLSGAHRVGVTSRAYQAVWLYAPRRRHDPVGDTERAFARLEFLLEQRYRPRRSTETTREYIAALQLYGVDERVLTVAAIHERALYGGGVTRAEATEAVAIVRRLLLESIPGIRRLIS